MYGMHGTQGLLHQWELASLPRQTISGAHCTRSCHALVRHLQRLNKKPAFHVTQVAAGALDALDPARALHPWSWGN